MTLIVYRVFFCFRASADKLCRILPSPAMEMIPLAAHLAYRQQIPSPTKTQNHTGIPSADTTVCNLPFNQIQRQIKL